MLTLGSWFQLRAGHRMLHWGQRLVRGLWRSGRGGSQGHGEAGQGQPPTAGCSGALPTLRADSVFSFRAMWCNSVLG